MQVGTIPGIRALWDETRGHPEVCVAVVDGPVDVEHACFAGASLSAVETLVPNAPDGGAATKHGTHIASVLFGTHSGSLPGLVPNCRGLIVPVFASGEGDTVVPCSQIDLARAILQAAQAGANVINVSGGQYSASGTAFPLLANAVKFCAENGVLIVGAAGNDGCECLHIPSALPSVLAVGAMDDAGTALGLSNWGAAYRQQGIVAPGVGILGAAPGGGSALLGGTSVSAAVVSGVVALLMSLQVRLGQRPDAYAVREAILKSARGCAPDDGSSDCQRLLVGRLNVPGAVDLLTGDGNAALSLSGASCGAGGGVIAPFGREPHEMQANVVKSNLEPSATRDGVNMMSVHSVTESPADVSACLSAPQLEADQASVPSNGISPSGCGCGCAGGGAKQLVYALGSISYDFGTVARRDSIADSMGGNPSDPKALLAYLQQNPWDAASIIWTLQVEDVPIYALAPSGTFATQAYERIRQFVGEQESEGVEIVSIPGVVNGKATLTTGQTLPTISPEIRGMASWNRKALLEALGAKNVDDTGFGNFLDRVYYSVRNMGLTPQERTINFSATNAFNARRAFELAIKEGLQLDEFDVERSPLCRPDSECWDVKLIFFFPEAQDNFLRRVYRFTIDVSDVVPVMIGSMKVWNQRVKS